MGPMSSKTIPPDSTTTLEPNQLDNRHNNPTQEEIVIEEAVPPEQEPAEIIETNSISMVTDSTIIYPDEEDPKELISLCGPAILNIEENESNQNPKNTKKRHVVKSLLSKTVIGTRYSSNDLTPITIYKQKWSDGTEFLGDFSKNQANGIGKFTLKNKYSYLGEFFGDHACGFGIFFHATEFFMGEWNKDEKNGFCFERSQDNFYCGEYSNSKKNGWGEMFWKDKSMYFGEWKNNLMHGLGVYRFADGRIYAGEWNENKMHGEGEFKWKDGTRYIGSYVNDKKEGFGVHFNQQRTKLYEGYWANGKQEGVGKTISNKLRGFGHWIEGNFEGWVDVNKDLNIYNVTKDDLKKISLMTKQIIERCVIEEIEKSLQVRIQNFNEQYESFLCSISINQNDL